MNEDRYQELGRFISQNYAKFMLGEARLSLIAVSQFPPVMDCVVSFAPSYERYSREIRATVWEYRFHFTRSRIPVRARFPVR